MCFKKNRENSQVARANSSKCKPYCLEQEQRGQWNIRNLKKINKLQSKKITKVAEWSKGERHLVAQDGNSSTQEADAGKSQVQG